MYSTDPALRARVHYLQVWQRMGDVPFVNPALSVEVLPFRRIEGDWLGVVITPWAIQLVLLPGGGTLWGDIPAGQRRFVSLPVGTLAFIADQTEAGRDEAALPVFQYCTLMSPVDALATQEQARRFAMDSLLGVLLPGSETDPPEVAKTEVARSVGAEAGDRESQGGTGVSNLSTTMTASRPKSGEPAASAVSEGRRGFFRRLVGR